MIPPAPPSRRAGTVRLGGRRLTVAAADARAWEAEVVVGVALHNQAGSIRSCLTSVRAQTGLSRPPTVVILDDGSSDDWVGSAGDLLAHPGVIVVTASCGSAAAARNAVLDFVDACMPSARWVARLDADDRFSTGESLASACDLANRRGATFVLGGNRLRRDGHLLAKANPASQRLLDPSYVVDRVRGMADGTAENELPSCNLLVARGAGWRYPGAASAEDHWLVADLLINRRHVGAILETPFYCDYTLGGAETARNRRADRYVASRTALFAAAETWATAGCTEP